jgi:hypothetical protein
MKTDKALKTLNKLDQKVEEAREKLYALHRERDAAAGAYLTAHGWKRVIGRHAHDVAWISNTGTAYTTFAAIREQRQRDKRNARARAKKAAKAQAPA